MTLQSVRGRSEKGAGKLVERWIAEKEMVHV